MELLEREQEEQALTAVLSDVAAQHGRVALVSGEAGIGKTVLVERIADRARETATVLWGGCEALFTPRPLGPLYDIAQQTQGRLLGLLQAQAPRTTVFAAFLDEMAVGPVPNVVVVEDAHWADEATLDLLKFVGRRIHRTRTLLIVTYRDDEVGPDHSLRYVLGDLPRQWVRRIRLAPLSPAAVADLAHRAGRSKEGLHALTGGNPFFVSEILASDDDGVPATVRDAVLARAVRLSPAAREALNLTSVAPRRMERRLLDDLLGPSSSAALAECLGTGMLRPGPDSVTFRHELARRAVEESLPSSQRRALHRRVFAALTAHAPEPPPLARLVHHATQAGDWTAVLRYAPDAARQAALHGAHREAASHYRSALLYAEKLAPEEHAELLEGAAYECQLTGRIGDAIQAREKALEIWRALGNRLKEGENLRLLSREAWYAGQGERSRACAREAVALLESQPPGHDLAMAYGVLSQQHMIDQETAEAVHWGSKAFELAEQLGDVGVMIHALNNIGSAQLMASDEAGRAKLERSLQLSLENEFHDHAARAYINLSFIAAFLARDHERALRYLGEGIAYCRERDLDSAGLCMTGERAVIYLRQGRWMDATDSAAFVLAHQQVPLVDKILPLVVLGLVRARRGDPDADALLDEARELAVPTGELQRIVPVSVARAELVWLKGGDPEQIESEIRAAYEMVLEGGNAWDRGEVAFWKWRAGGHNEAPEGAAEPYRLQIAGDWRAAADAWQRLGCPYEQADALADGDERAQLQALEIFERLGAGVAADILRRRMRTLGIRGIPRGPRSSTLENPFGLTDRQLEVLALVSQGMSNTEIAGRLFISPKTAGHHVSNILAKLDVRSRVEAATIFVEQGLPGEHRD